MPGTNYSRLGIYPALAVLVSLWWHPYAAAAPGITNLPIRGLQSGATTTLTIEGADLLPETRVILPVAILSQNVRSGATPNRVQIDVRLPADIAPGLYALRVANSHGISNPVVIGIDDLAQVPFAAQVAKLPAALHGTLSGSATLSTSFVGKKGQRIVVDVEARRLGAMLDPVLELLDGRRVQLAWSAGQAALQGDARLEAVLPVDSTYSVVLRDMLYRAGYPNQFRLKMGTLCYADIVFPLGARRGSEASFELIGPTRAPGPRVLVDLRHAGGDVPAPLPLGFVGPSPAILVSDWPEVLQAEPAKGKLQDVAIPAVIEGRLGQPHQEDRYRLLVKPGMRLQLDVRANRSGAPLDGVMAVRDEAGATLAESDDRSDTVDPGLDFTVPANVHALVVALRDLQGRGGPDFVYRLSVIPADQPDFTLLLFEDRCHVPRTGAAVLRVRANRSNYNGPIKLALDGIPEGIAVSGDVIPAGASDTLLTLAAPARLSPTQALMRIVGESTEPPISLRRTALFPVIPGAQSQPWLRSDVGVAVVEASPVQIAWDTDEPSLAIGSSYIAKVKVTRGRGVTGTVRLALETSQLIPRASDGRQDDMNRGLRFEGVPTIPDRQSSTAARIIIPADLPALAYDLAVRAELLGGDGKTVLASAVTPARRLAATRALTLQLAGPATVQAKSGSGPTGKLSGKLLRSGGFNREVTVSLIGLPPELPAPQVTVPGDRSAFELPVSFPYETKLGPLANVRIQATSQVSAQQIVRSNELAVTVQVVQGDPPPPAPALYRVFEDEPSLLALLHEGDGQISMETLDRYSGSSALRVTATQRYRTKMPGWGYRIAAQPGNGEFRYLRFAWKKRGGSNIMLQLNANGNWGPARTTTGPSYRYEAGPGDNPFNAAAIKVDAKLPEDWVMVTRDLFGDFGAFVLNGIALTPGPGDYGLFDHIYLARSLDDLKGCAPQVAPVQPLVVFEDQPGFVNSLLEGAGTVQLDANEKYSGKSSARVTPDQRFNERMPGLGIAIRQNPGPGEYRFLRFAWKKKGGQTICLQLNHDGQWGPTNAAPAKFRYHAGTGPEPYGASIPLDAKIPSDWVVVTRDLYADFGEFTWTGIALSPVDGEAAWFDHIYLGKTPRDFELVRPK
jgi:hypothetical protein